MGSRWSSEVTVLQSFHNSACPNLPWPLTSRVNKQTKKTSQGWKGQDMKPYLHCGIINVRPVGNWISPVDSEPASVRKMWWAVIKATVLMYEAGYACIKGRLKTSSFIIIHDVVASGVSYTRVTLLTYTRLNKKKRKNRKQLRTHTHAHTRAVMEIFTTSVCLWVKFNQSNSDNTCSASTPNALHNWPPPPHTVWLSGLRKQEYYYYCYYYIRVPVYAIV